MDVLTSLSLKTIENVTVWLKLAVKIHCDKDTDFIVSGL